MAQSRYNPWLHRAALLTTGATFPLIFMGGLVTSHQAGMSVPDWPNSYGYNMFLFPPRLWIGGILYEHTHRLMGAVVGLLAIVLTVLAWTTEDRRWIRWLCTGVLGMVIFQGVLGGLRVVLVQLDLAIAHACVAQAFFCLAALCAVGTSKWWVDAPDCSHSNNRVAGKRLVVLASVCVGAVYLQLIVGATMRHYQAGLAIPDVPLAYGKLLPPTSDAALKTVNDVRAWQLQMAPVTLAQVWLNFAHRVGAIVVSIFATALVIAVLRRHHRHGGLMRPAILVAILLQAQLALGVLTIVLRKPADIASSHVAVGALLLASCFVLCVRAMRLYARTFRRVAPALEGVRGESFRPVGKLVTA
ncbi:MAG: COX15/CtaA family protein [Tepidisphaeraceae bacterium]